MIEYGCHIFISLGVGETLFKLTSRFVAEHLQYFSPELPHKIMNVVQQERMVLNNRTHFHCINVRTT